jgi:hypothetical protein
MDRLIYARWLAVGTRIALTLLIGTFAVYALGLLEPLVPLGALPELWRLPVGEFIAATGAPTGWGWLARLGAGDYLNLAGVAFLGGVSVVCYLRVIPHYWRKGDRALAWLAIAQVLVLLAAASGAPFGH